MCLVRNWVLGLLLPITEGARQGLPKATKKQKNTAAYDRKQGNGRLGNNRNLKIS
jgi:hypothetical protein